LGGFLKLDAVRADTHSVGLAEEWVVTEDGPTTFEQIEQLQVLIDYLEEHPDAEAGFIDASGRSYLEALRHLVSRITRVMGFHAS